jgi:hypothetical protein
VGVGRAEQYAVGHDHRRSPAGLQQPQEQGQKQQLGLFRLDDLQQVLGGGLVIQAAGKGRIGEDQRVFLLFQLVGLGQGVAVADVGVLHAVQQHVHAADAKHGAVEVEAVERAGVELAAAGLGLVDGVAVMPAEIFRGGDQEAGGAEGRVADHVFWHGGGHVHHQPDDVARGAELAVLPGGGDLAQHVFVEVALGVAVGHVDAVELVHHIGQHAGRGHHEDGVPHMVGIG